MIRRSFSTSSGGHIRFTKHTRTQLIFGSNTDVGKTVISAGLVKTSLKKGGPVHYIKPLQCGGSDEAFVNKYAAGSTAATLFSWDTPASPHVASIKENSPQSDKQVLTALEQRLAEITATSATTWIETAGGVLSPSSASPLNSAPNHASSTNGWGWSTQADLYQPLLGIAPVVLVGDGRLGGISATLSSLESLILRGYDVAGIVLLETDHDNISALREHAGRTLKLRAGTGQALFRNPKASIVSLPELPPQDVPLHEWYDSAQVAETLESFDQHLEESWNERVEDVQAMRQGGRDAFWWPFTQHGNVEDDTKVTLIDSANGDNYQVLKDGDNGLELRPMFDACASWWTQGVGHGESTMALASAAAAGRFGHVIFPDVVHQPALRLSQRLIGPKGPGYGWASRVFFTDDGSTAMEVSVKMGMKTYQKWHGLSDEQACHYDWTVCAQQDCYHGDTLGVMDIAEPSIFNEGQHPWYEPKALFLAIPTLGFHNGDLKVSIPETNESVGFVSIEEAMDVESRLGTSLYTLYSQSIEKQWDAYESNTTVSKPRKIGSVLIEPILVGAGGMKFVDPLWQRALMGIARSKRVPVVFDEVASGLFRVGVSSCREILKADPDIACYAKLLTGGIVPMSVTLASEDVFETFLGNEKCQALLHGHSYTAHAIGCVSALHALEVYDEVLGKDSRSTRSFHFDINKVRDLSKLRLVQQSFSLGTVVAVTIRPDDNGRIGYAAGARTEPIIKMLRDKGVFARPLGNVIYIMSSPLTSRENCSELLETLATTIERYGEELDLQREVNYEGLSIKHVRCIP
jgi:bifunctional dethiobiotin synthetase / adenosylmethionine---8-amino-7-oxononanoate aminotransferase